MAVPGTAAGSNLDPYPLALPAHCLPQVVHLRADDIVDCLFRSVDIFANGIGDVIDRNRFDEILATLARRTITAL